MLNQIPIHNAGTTNMHIGGVVIRPGATRMIDERLVPGHLKPATTDAGEEETADDPVANLLDLNVASIVAALPEFGDLDALEAAETEGKARKGVLEGIAHERLRRAAADTDA